MSDTASPPEGHRKDGQPFKTGNTREDGTYVTGKYRPPPEHQFKTGDGRQRGRRANPIEERPSHFGITEHRGPFPEGEVGGDDDAGPLIKLADQMEEQLAA